MNKKIFSLGLLLALFTLPLFSNSGVEFGIGSGYVFYGDKETKNRNKALGDINQTIFCMDALLLMPMNKQLVFSVGGDAVFDFRWQGSDHIYLMDYALLAGFRVYPNLGGLYASVDYALGRRTDVISFDDHDQTQKSCWGNGFKFALAYDFSYHLNSIAPVICASLKSMPRGGSRDNIFCVSVKLSMHD
ncbi:hypothetical protein [uncultured Treponema sp.]|uniref:hypothetical protein n=1 Tax=uncultured Treponema sp. TaxID=162155 RepID=UPI0025D4C396|nr:hypothetical protein [uncultured Treponema sp.]